MDINKINSLISVDLVAELGLQSLPLEQRTAMLAQISDIIMKGVWLKVMDLLTEAQANELEKIYDTSNPEEMYAFLQKEIPGFEDIIKAEVASYKEMMLSSFKK
ncbi:MAG: DUF5663 domain-containing protein [bacterium]|nr:DUF5663 domain-containing protein [Candidatus Jorgensenbacteria bacterium]